MSYVQFLDRVSAGERKLRGEGLWDVPHPWFNLFLPRSRILDFAVDDFHSVLLRGGGGGPVLVYPMNRGKWDGATSAVLPLLDDNDDEEEVFYMVGILRSAVADGDLRQIEGRRQRWRDSARPPGATRSPMPPLVGMRRPWWQGSPLTGALRLDQLVNLGLRE